MLSGGILHFTGVFEELNPFINRFTIVLVAFYFLNISEICALSDIR
jgi:hypothetical protein